MHGPGILVKEDPNCKVHSGDDDHSWPEPEDLNYPGEPTDAIERHEDIHPHD